MCMDPTGQGRAGGEHGISGCKCSVCFAWIRGSCVWGCGIILGSFFVYVYVQKILLLDEGLGV